MKTHRNALQQTLFDPPKPDSEEVWLDAQQYRETFDKYMHGCILEYVLHSLTEKLCLYWHEMDSQKSELDEAPMRDRIATMMAFIERNYRKEPWFDLVREDFEMLDGVLLLREQG